MNIEFKPFPKIPRLFRHCVITEKIDGTNGVVYVGEDGTVLAGSRNRWLTKEGDNFGFAAWVEEHAQELREGLGPGTHFGEWWGRGIQRGYGLDHCRFSLFNVNRWHQYGGEPRRIPTGDPRLEKWTSPAPKCCYVVPVILEGTFYTSYWQTALNFLRENGSKAAPGFLRPEGIVVFHSAANQLFKATLDDDEQPKSAT